MKSRCQEWRLYSPSVTSLSPSSSCSRTTSRIAACWIRLSSASEISFFSAFSRASMRAGGGRRLPTCSARKGGLVRSIGMGLRCSGPPTASCRTIAHVVALSCRLRRRPTCEGLEAEGRSNRRAFHSANARPRHKRPRLRPPRRWTKQPTENEMKAAVATENGVAVRDIPQPRPKPNEVLVKVRAAALNRADLATARGIPHGSHGGIGAAVGLEWAGEVVESGAEAKSYKPGDRVLCAGPGGYAEFAVSDWGRVNPMPNGMSFEQAATLPVSLITLHNALVTAGRLVAGESVMIQGASSGVGLMGLQIAKLKGAKPVIGTSTNDARRTRLPEFAADLALDTREAGFADAVLGATGGKGVDLVVDMLSGPVVAQSMRAVAILGRMVNVGRLAGAKAEFDFDLHALRRIDYIGVTFRTRTLEEVRDINRRMRADLWEAVTAGKLSLPIDSRFPLDAAVEAQAHMRANKHFGKIVLAM